MFLSFGESERLELVFGTRSADYFKLGLPVGTSPVQVAIEGSITPRFIITTEILFSRQAFSLVCTKISTVRFLESPSPFVWRNCELIVKRVSVVTVHIWNPNCKFGLTNQHTASNQNANFLFHFNLLLIKSLNKFYLAFD